MTSDNLSDIELGRFDLTVRTANLFAREEIKTVGALMELSAADILRWYGAGKKTVSEVRSLLSSLGLQLIGDPRPDCIVDTKIFEELSVAPVSQPTTKELAFDDAGRNVQMRLVSRLQSFSLSTRALNVLIQEKLLYLGELVQLTRSDLKRFHNAGKRTIDELAELVQKQGLELGTQIPDWSRELAAKMEASFAAERVSETKERSSEVLATIGPQPTCLEEELERIAFALALGDDRNAQVVVKLWGWNGSEPRTLESVGQEYLVTRERIRQIESRAIKRLKGFEFERPYLRSAIASLRENVPALASRLKKKPQEGGFARDEFSPASLKYAASLLRVHWPFAYIAVGPQRILIEADDEQRFAKLLPIVRRRTSEMGCLNILSLALEIHVSEDYSDRLRRFLDVVPGIEWLDGSKEWLYFREGPRNRLINLCSKVLGACPEISVRELRRAVSKSRRLPMVPPQKVLAAFIEGTGLGRIHAETAIADPARASPPARDSVEGKLLNVLDEFGPVMDGEELAERCIAAGMNATTFYIYRMISPVVAALGKGIYCKVGSKVPPGTIEDILSRRRSTTRISDHGWTPEGRLWFAAELPRIVITAGAIRLPSSVAELVQGEWQICLPDGEDYGSVTCRDAFIWTFRKAFAVLGVEPGECVALVFDTRDRHVLVKAGGPELFESIESPVASESSEADEDL